MAACDVHRRLPGCGSVQEPVSPTVTQPVVPEIVITQPSDDEESAPPPYVKPVYTPEEPYVLYTRSSSMLPDVVLNAPQDAPPYRPPPRAQDKNFLCPPEDSRLENPSCTSVAEPPKEASFHEVPHNCELRSPKELELMRQMALKELGIKQRTPSQERRASKLKKAISKVFMIKTTSSKYQGLISDYVDPQHKIPKIVMEIPQELERREDLTGVYTTRADIESNVKSLKKRFKMGEKIQVRRLRVNVIQIKTFLLCSWTSTTSISWPTLYWVS